MRFGFHVALTVLCLPLTAQAVAGCERCSKDYRVCVANANGMSFAIQACQAKEEEVQEARLSAAFQRALRRLTPERQEELRHVHRTWIAYRLAAGRYYVDKGLSGHKIHSSDRHLQITVERIAELNETDY